jgi:hypothetical protein
MRAIEHSPDLRIAATPDPAAVVSKATIRAADHLGLSQQVLGRVLGLSAATVTRLKAGTFSLPHGGKPYELALLLIRLFRGLDAMMGGDVEALRSWMQTTNLALGGVPREVIASVSGLVETVAYVDSARARL